MQIQTQTCPDTRQSLPCSRRVSSRENSWPRPRLRRTGGSPSNGRIQALLPSGPFSSYSSRASLTRGGLVLVLAAGPVPAHVRGPPVRGPFGRAALRPGSPTPSRAMRCRRGRMRRSLRLGRLSRSKESEGLRRWRRWHSTARTGPTPCVRSRSWHAVVHWPARLGQREGARSANSTAG